ncbi:alpha-N-acetylgalactosamine-specific lectin-like [Montipora capricornis]|uniref:alpha-N-acetylgalactosamine-specific lectin-like n=1 Tax=Montipora capricornis TaxID=246305 RepID=UPI0035F2172D
MKALSILLLLLAVVTSRIAALDDAKLVEMYKQTFGAQCPSGWERFGRYCYLVSGSILSWDQARSYCRTRGGELVKINSAEENEFVLNLTQQRQPSLTLVWINLKWDSSANQFLWNDHSVPVYTNWASNEPNGKANEPCAHIYSSVGQVAGFWNDRPCSRLANTGLACKRLP